MTQTSQRTYFLCGSLLLLLMAGCSSHHRPTASYNSHAYDGIIYAAAAQYNLDPKLIKAIIQVESSYNPSAVSPSNAIGLMQIKADGAGCDAYRYQGRHGCPDSDDLYDPATNIRLGAAYLSALQNQQLYWINDPPDPPLCHRGGLRQRCRSPAAHLLSQPSDRHRHDQQPDAGSLSLARPQPSSGATGAALHAQGRNRL